MRYLRIARSAFNEAMADDLMDWSAALAYYFLFSLFPLILLAASLLGAFRMTALVNKVIFGLSIFLPHDAATLVSRQLDHLIVSNHAGLISFGTLLTLYSASQAFSGLMTALDTAYEVRETRPFFHRFGLALGLTFSAGVLMLLALVSLLLGQKVLMVVTGTPYLGVFATAVWPIVRWILAFAFLVASVVILYRTAPNMRPQKVGFIPAAVTACLLWGLATLGLGFYIDHFSNYSVLYGSLGAVIALMLWFYVSAFSLLLGAEVHSEILKERGIYTKPKYISQAAEAKKQQGVAAKAPEEPPGIKAA
jgi:membrane protein